MALISIGNGVSVDTDEFEQSDYFYYCEATHIEEVACRMRNTLPGDSVEYKEWGDILSGVRKIRRRILLGRLKTYEIETSPEYIWFLNLINNGI